MSSRALRRLQKNSLEDTLATLAPGADEEETDVDYNAVRTKTPVNMFALMGEGDDEDDDEQEKESSDNGQTNEAFGTHVPATTAIPDSKQSAGKTQSKKTSRNKKKKKRANKNTKKHPEKHTDLREGSGTDEELDQIIKQFQDKEKSADVHVGHSSGSDFDYDTANEEEEEEEQFTYRQKGRVTMVTDPGFTHFRSYSELSRIFGSIDMKKLNPDYEYKLLFGDLSAESLADVDSMTSTHVSPQVMRQIDKLKSMVRNWGGKDHKTVPNGSTVRRLAFTKIRNDWIPTARGEFTICQLSQEEVREWNAWQRPQDWMDEIETTCRKLEKVGINFYKFEPSNADLNRKAMTEFYMSVVLHPDHEALINLISTKFPYHVPSLLQVALIFVRQGEKTNSNGLVERALFVFDRALRAHITFNGTACQLPFIYFYNRQFYSAIFRYIQILSQRGAVSTASEWCKVLWSLSPLEDPLGCRYFIDHYLLMNKEYGYMIKLANSALINTYKEWYTLGMSLGFVLSYLKLDRIDEAKLEIKKAFQQYPESLTSIFVQGALGDSSYLNGLQLPEESPNSALEVKAYLIRMKVLWGGTELKFLGDQIKVVIDEYKAGAIQVSAANNVKSENPFFLGGYMVNLLRFAVLSQESPLMACIPEEIWSEREVYEFDVLPPEPHGRETEELIESAKSFISENDLNMTRLEMMQDENLINQITQMSLEQFLQENPNAGIDE
ncbi:LADA_0F11716g1_1 [Lachancea dasiensis]|uniref:LADA_0F11716g1_1 n=1 Tax=Lachancea dasiensis TaxID=1072105 RepID=A0A1G4JMG9_9SACH|nr:LADA_0F11716g1_1 [Lachancea dasiensis]